MSQYWLATFSEFIGTALLILLGNGVCAAVSYKRMGTNQAGKFVCIILGWGLAVFLAALVSSSMGGVGHLNPAVTIMDAIKAGGTIKELPVDNIYVLGKTDLKLPSVEASIGVTFVLFTILQFVGAMFGQVVSNFINFKFITDKENDLLTIRGCHATAPAYENKKDKATIFNFAYEFIGTLVLVGLIVAFGAGSNKIDGNNGALGTIPVAFLIMSIGLSLGSATGYAINPVRDFCPRMVFVLFAKIFRKDEFNKGMINWEYAWVPVVAPMLAGAIVGLITLI